MLNDIDSEHIDNHILIEQYQRIRTWHISHNAIDIDADL
jgi:hypothetical protein